MPIRPNTGNYTGWATDWDGTLRNATTTDGVNTGLKFRNKEEKFKTIH
jgi:hypothetical protein